MKVCSYATYFLGYLIIVLYLTAFIKVKLLADLNRFESYVVILIYNGN